MGYGKSLEDFKGKQESRKESLREDYESMQKRINECEAERNNFFRDWKSEKLRLEGQIDAILGEIDENDLIRL